MHDIDMPMKADRKSRRAPRLMLSVFRPLLVPLASFVIAVLIIFVAGQSDQFGPDPRLVFDSPPVVQGQGTFDDFTVTPGDEQVTITWRNTIAGASVYIVNIQQGGDTMTTYTLSNDQNRNTAPSPISMNLRAADNTIIITGLANNTQYRFRVQAIGLENTPIGSSSYSDWYQPMTATHTPTPTATSTPAPDSTATATPDIQTPGVTNPVEILRIEPDIESVSIRTGDEVRLSVQVYGLQDKRDDSLGDAEWITFDWSSDGGGSFSESAPVGRSSNGVADDRKVLHAVPDTPGRYKVTASLDDSECEGDDEQCKAEFIMIVHRSIAAGDLSPTPCALSGTIPSVLSDSDGVQYSVFTPVDGGSFLSADESSAVTAGAGSVRGCEYIGVRMDMRGDAADLNRASNRYTLAGDVYSVTAVDSSGNMISDYEFLAPVQVCVPLPSSLRGNITELGMAKINDDGGLTILTHRIVSSANGAVRVCGALGVLPADVSAGKRGAPDSPTPVPVSPTPESPATGGASVPYSWVLLISVLGVGVIMLGSMILARRRL